MKKILPFLFLLSAFLPQLSCGPTFQKLGASLIDGVKSNNRIDSLTTQAARGLIDGITNGAAAQKIDSLISSLGHQLRLSVDSIVLDVKDSVIILRDSIIGKYLEDHVAAIRDSLTGSPMRKNLSLLIDTLLGKNTKRKINSLIASAVNTALSDSTRYKLNHLLDSLGSTASIKVGALVDTAVAHILSGTKNIGTSANTELTFLQRHVIPLLASAAAIIVAATGLIIYFFRRKNKYAQLSGLLTYQIHQTKSDNTFKDIKERVSDQAKRENLEPLLRDLLMKKGMLGDQTRQTVGGRTS